MKIEELDIEGCFLITPKVFKDNRGEFIKTYNSQIFEAHGINNEFKEEYYSLSHEGVVRGMHFQTPPFEHDKMVYCIKGSVLDVFVDLRKGSATYLEHISIELNERNKEIIVLPKGIAHGFCSLEDNTLMIYKTSTVYAPENDDGVLWDSCNIEWPSLVNPCLISDRDKSFKRLEEFDSPF